MKTAKNSQQSTDVSVEQKTGTKCGFRDLHAPDIAQHLKMMQDADAAANWHFNVRSRFTAALRDHLVHASDENCLIDRNGRVLAFHRGSGASVRFKDPFVHFAMPGESEMMSFKLEVGLCPTEDDIDAGRAADREITVVESVHFPSDLELNFSEEKFKAWLKEARQELRARQAEPELRTLKTLIKKYPKHAAELTSKRKSKNSQTNA